MKTVKNIDNLLTKRVSFIIPTKNRVKYFKKALKIYRSLRKKGDELVVIDGNSSDQTIKVAKRSKLIDIFLSEPDLNNVHATNKGLLLARGKYAVILPDDDTIFSQGLEKAVETMEKHQEIDVLVCGGIVKYEGKRALHYNYVGPGQNYGKSVLDVFIHGACGLGFLIRKSSLAKSNLFPNTPIADLAFMVNCIKIGLNVKFCRIKMYQATIYKHSIIISQKDSVQKEVKKLTIENTSTWFYYKRRFKDLIWSYTRYKPVLILVTLIADLLHTIRDRKNYFVPKKRVRYLWDGGFS